MWEPHRHGSLTRCLRHGLKGHYSLRRFRSGPGEGQGDSVRDAVQILNDLGAKPEPSRPKLAFPPRVDLGRFAPQGRRPVIFGDADFATAVAAEVAGKSDEFESAFALRRRRLGAIEERGPCLLVEMFQKHRFDLTQALVGRQLLGRKGVVPDGLLCDGHEFAKRARSHWLPFRRRGLRGRGRGGIFRPNVRLHHARANRESKPSAVSRLGGFGIWVATARTRSERLTIPTIRSPCITGRRLMS